ncbi:glycoside hydrolase family 19 protein [Deinococcus altitudinis]|uniref:glycoside hydrolase family 19 protein n=1 Tax=Deinococcus altitudinis TaxID=468914 RepID=UPI003891390D
MKLTLQLTQQLAYPNMPIVLAQVWTDKLGATCADPRVNINTPQRMAHFLTQLTHESAGFRYMSEIWGPTPAQLRYEGRLDLGNTQPGDGYRYRGRGPLQLTGRANYRNTGKRIGQPLEDEPERASQIGVGSLIACDYWTTHGLNRLADQGGLVMVQSITRAVNGGLNGLADRERRYKLAAAALGIK